MYKYMFAMAWQRWALGVCGQGSATGAAGVPIEVGIGAGIGVGAGVWPEVGKSSKAGFKVGDSAR